MTQMPPAEQLRTNCQRELVLDQGKLGSFEMSRTECVDVNSLLSCL